MEKDAKAKVVTSVRGADFVLFLAALTVLLRSVWKNRLNSSYFSWLTGLQNIFRFPNILYTTIQTEDIFLDYTTLGQK